MVACGQGEGIEAVGIGCCAGACGLIPHRGIDERLTTRVAHIAAQRMADGGRRWLSGMGHYDRVHRRRRPAQDDIFTHHLVADARAFKEHFECLVERLPFERRSMIGLVDG